MKGFIAVILMLLIFSCHRPDRSKAVQEGSISGDLIIFHAGSLSAPFKQIARAFEKEYPGTRVLLEAAGSVDCARKITDLKKPCDLMASSDYKVIEKLLIPDHTKWYMPFAGNEMVIAFTGSSLYADQINKENWHQILLQEDVHYGRSDPDADPCGYRSIMVMQLAAHFYGLGGLTDKLQAKDRKYIRPKEVDLLALLELHETDYIFIYKSVAIQHGLKYLELPDEINLKEPDLNELYGKISVNIKGETPKSTMEITGEAIIYAITMLKSSPNPATAKAFLTFLLDNDRGMKILTESGHNSLLPLNSDQSRNLPEFLQKYVTSSFSNI